MKPLITYAAILWCFTFVFAQSDNFNQALENLPPRIKVEKMYDHALNDLKNDSISSLLWLQRGIDLSKGINDKNLELRGWLSKSDQHLKFNQPVKALNASMKVLHQHHSLGDSLEERLYDLLGNALYELQAYELTIMYRKKMMELMGECAITDKYYITENIAYCFSKIHLKDSADFYYLKSMEIANSTKDTNLILHCHNNIGYHYILNKNFEKSYQLFNNADQLFKAYSKRENRDSVIYAMILSNTADYYINNLNLDKAKEKLYKSGEFLSSSDSTFQYGNYYRLARIHFMEKNIDSSLFYLGLMKKWSGGDQYKEGYYRIQIGIAQLNKDLAKERYFNQELLEYFSSKKNDRLNQLIVELVEAQNEEVRQNLLKETSFLKQKTKLAHTKIWIISVSGIIVILLLLFFFMYFRKKRKEIEETKYQLKEQEVAMKRKEADRLQNELKNKNLDLTEFGIELSRKNEFLRDIHDKLKAAKSVENIQLEVLKDLQNHLHVDEGLELFHENVNKVNHEFMNKLTTNFPNLTANDKQICALLKLQLSSKEIATLKNISTESVKKIRYRLRKKMELDPKTDLTEFFRNY